MAATLETPVAFLTTGASIHTFTVGGHNICLSLPSASDYPSNAFFGETIGRVANRIANGTIKSLNNRSYTFAKNEKNTNTLHGGKVGWGKKEWKGPKPVERNGREEVVYTYVSEDGEEGFPGKVECRCFYWVGRKVNGEGGGAGKEEVVLEVEYEVEMVGDEKDVSETCVNVTNHSFFNLSPNSNTADTVVTFGTTIHQPIDDDAIPTGELTPFPNLTPNKPTTFTATGPFIDHCLIINNEPSTIPIDTRSQPLKHAVTLFHPSTNITLKLETTEPAFQFYTGDGINLPAVGDAGPWGSRAGIALEPSRYVNAANVPEWRDMVVLKRGEVYGGKSRYTAWAA